MLDDQLHVSGKYVDENEYDAGPRMPVIFEQSVAVAVYSPEDNKDTLKLKYVQEEQFARILKQVKRSKKKEREDREWAKFLIEKKIACKFYMERDESESLTTSALSISPQNVVQKYCDAGLKQPLPGRVHSDCQKYCDSLSKEAAYKSCGGTMLDNSDAGKRDKMCRREENVSVVQKTNTENLQMMTLLSHPKFHKHSSNMSPETIREVSVCLPNSNCSMLNDIKFIYQHRPCHMNKNCKSEIPKSFHEHHMIESSRKIVVPSDVTKLNPYAVSKESIVSQRIRFMWKKMNAAFDDICSLYNKVPEPDGNQDLLRRCKRAAEFSCRFSRNYLCQLRWQMCELKKQIGESSSLSTAQHTPHQLVCRKLAIAHHSALQGLQAYLHHMPSSVQCAASDKLKELLHYICDLSSLCNRVEIASADSASELGPDYIEKKSKALLQLINSKNMVNKFQDGLPASHNTAVNIMTTTGEREWESSLREPEQTQAPMISARGQCSVRKIISWKEPAAKLARAVYGAPAKKCDSAVFKRNKRFTVSKARPPLQCESELKMFCDLASLIHMRHLSNELTGICEDEFWNKLKSVVRNLVDKSETEISQGSVKRPDVQSSTLVDDMKPVLQQVRDTVSHSLQQSESQHTTQGKDEVKATKIGPQNAQLIFLLPEPHDALLDPADNKESKVTRPRSQDTVSLDASDTVDCNVHCTHKSRAYCKLKPNVLMMNSVKSITNVYHQHRPEDSPEMHCSMESSRKASTYANTKENVGRKQSRSRLQSPLTLPKQNIESAVDYHRKFHSYMKSNRMYETTASPWVMISRLSDQLIEKILQEVARETKLESLVQNISTLELQEEVFLGQSQLNRKILVHGDQFI